MDKLLKLAVEAHGGLRAWNRLRTLTANVSIGGALWDLKKLPGLFRNTRVDVKLHQQFNFVVSTNERAVKLWQSLGFEIVGRLPSA